MSSSSSLTLAQLPDTVLVAVFGCLADAKDKVRLAAVCRALRPMLRRRMAWTHQMQLSLTDRQLNHEDQPSVCFTSAGVTRALPNMSTAGSVLRLLHNCAPQHVTCVSATVHYLKHALNIYALPSDDAVEWIRAVEDDDEYDGYRPFFMHARRFTLVLSFFSLGVRHSHAPEQAAEPNALVSLLNAQCTDNLQLKAEGVPQLCIGRLFTVLPAARIETLHIGVHPDPKPVGLFATGDGANTTDYLQHIPDDCRALQTVDTLRLSMFPQVPNAAQLYRLTYQLRSLRSLRVSITLTDPFYDTLDRDAWLALFGPLPYFHQMCMYGAQQHCPMDEAFRIATRRWLLANFAQLSVIMIVQAVNATDQAVCWRLIADETELFIATKSAQCLTSISDRVQYFGRFDIGVDVPDELLGVLRAHWTMREFVPRRQYPDVDELHRLNMWRIPLLDASLASFDGVCERTKTRLQWLWVNAVADCCIWRLMRGLVGMLLVFKHQVTGQQFVLHIGYEMGKQPLQAHRPCDACQQELTACRARLALL